MGGKIYVLCDAYKSVGLTHAVCATGIREQNLCSLNYFTHALIIHSGDKLHHIWCKNIPETCCVSLSGSTLNLIVDTRSLKWT